MLALGLRCRLSVPVLAPRDLPVEPLNEERLAGRKAGEEASGRREWGREEEEEAGGY